jgi:hypothetical protein
MVSSINFWTSQEMTLLQQGELQLLIIVTTLTVDPHTLQQEYCHLI